MALDVQSAPPRTSSPEPEQPPYEPADDEHSALKAAGAALGTAVLGFVMSSGGQSTALGLGARVAAWAGGAALGPWVGAGLGVTAAGYMIYKALNDDASTKPHATGTPTVQPGQVRWASQPPTAPNSGQGVHGHSAMVIPGQVVLPGSVSHGAAATLPPLPRRPSHSEWVNMHALNKKPGEMMKLALANRPDVTPGDRKFNDLLREIASKVDAWQTQVGNEMDVSIHRWGDYAQALQGPGVTAHERMMWTYFGHLEVINATRNPDWPAQLDSEYFALAQLAPALSETRARTSAIDKVFRTVGSIEAMHRQPLQDANAAQMQARADMEQEISVQVASKFKQPAPLQQAYAQYIAAFDTYTQVQQQYYIARWTALQGLFKVP